MNKDRVWVTNVSSCPASPGSCHSQLLPSLQDSEVSSLLLPHSARFHLHNSRQNQTGTRCIALCCKYRDSANQGSMPLLSFFICIIKCRLSIQFDKVAPAAVKAIINILKPHLLFGPWIMDTNMLYRVKTGSGEDIVNGKISSSKTLILFSCLL